jgi:hypothetical protein
MKVAPARPGICNLSNLFKVLYRNRIMGVKIETAELYIFETLLDTFYFKNKIPGM